jgi:hypothetical protein
LTFKKSLEAGNIKWTAEGAAGMFWRPLRGDFSDADLTLTPQSCGPIYRILKISFAEDTKKEELVAFARRNPEIAKLPVTLFVPAAEEGRLREQRLQLSAALHELWTRSDLHYRHVHVPVGTEIAIVRALRQTEFLDADLGEGGCGGADASFFAFDRAVFFKGKTFLKDKFAAFTQQSLREFASRDRRGRTWDHTIGEGVVSTLKLPPFTSSYRVKMRVASEISRQSPGAWDTFDVALEPADLGMIKRTEYAVVVTVTNLRSIRRSTGRAIRLKDIYPYEPQATAEIESALLVFLSGRIKDGWCYYTAEGIDDPKVMCPDRHPEPNE